MARKSRLTENQWADIGRRHLAGEKLRPLAREFGIGESTAREKISAQTAQVKKVATQIVETQLALNELPIPAQISAQNYAHKLMAIVSNLGDAAIAGSSIAKRVSESTNRHIETLADDELLDEATQKTLMSAGMIASSHGKLGLEVLNMASKPNQSVTQPEEIKRIERVIVSSKD
jgi:hypothetical protein